MVSNHVELAELAEQHGVPVKMMGRASRTLAQVDVVALARFMQVLSGPFVEARPVIGGAKCLDGRRPTT